MFFFKRKKIVVDSFTSIGIVAEDYPIEKASKFIPNWWKTLPAYNTSTNSHGVEIQGGTMKGCLGFMDLYTNGFIVPLWADLNLRVDNGKFSYQFGAKTDSFGSVLHHPPHLYNNRYKNHLHFKIGTPWLFREKTGVKFVMTPCCYTTIEEIPKLSILNGVLSFDRTHSGNINGFALLENTPYQYNMKAGMPFIQLIPMTEDEVTVKNHHVTSAEWENLKYTFMPNKFYFWGITRRKTKK